MMPAREGHVERRDARTRAALLDRIRAEFEYMAGLSLTPVQAYRLFDVDAETGDRLLGQLVESGYLRRLPDGSYARAERE